MEHATQKLQEIEKYWKWYQINRYFGALAGAVIYSLGINLFIVPVSLYSGGIMGFAQVIRTVLVEYLHAPFQNFDVAGVIYYLINAPVLLLSMKRIGRRFFAKTVMCVTTVTVLLSVIPIPKQPILPEDTLACCVIGGIICGVGMGLALKCGGSLGGTDIVGMMLIKWRRDFRVGRVNMAVNVVLYGVCLFLFNVPTVIYSLIYAFVSAFAIDKVHAQTINVEVRVSNIYEKLNAYTAEPHGKACTVAFPLVRSSDGLQMSNGIVMLFPSVGTPELQIILTLTDGTTKRICQHLQQPLEANNKLTLTVSIGNILEEETSGSIAVDKWNESQEEIKVPVLQ